MHRHQALALWAREHLIPWPNRAFPARRLTVHFEDKKNPNLFVRPLSRVPGYTDAEAIARDGLLAKTFLLEDASVTMNGLMETAHGVAHATAVAAVELWDQRRQDPDLVPQPERQWPKLGDVSALRFKGCKPTRLPPIVKGSQSLYVTPDWIRRINSAKLAGDHETQWRKWLRD